MARPDSTSPAARRRSQTRRPFQESSSIAADPEDPLQAVSDHELHPQCKALKATTAQVSVGTMLADARKQRFGGPPGPPVAPHKAAYVDHDHLLRLSRQLGAGSWQLISELILILESDLIEHLPVLHRLAAAGDAPGLAKEAHRLRGQALTLAAARLAEVCESIEIAAGNDDLAAARAPLAEIQRVSARSLELLRHLLQAAPVASDALSQRGSAPAQG